MLIAMQQIVNLFHKEKQNTTPDLAQYKESLNRTLLFFHHPHRLILLYLDINRGNVIRGVIHIREDNAGQYTSSFLVSPLLFLSHTFLTLSGTRFRWFLRWFHGSCFIDGSRQTWNVYFPT